MPARPPVYPQPSRLTATAVACLLLLADAPHPAAGGETTRATTRETIRDTTPQTAAELRQRALELAYNLDYGDALALLRRAVEAAPDDPATRRTLATVLWLKLLFERGAVTVDHYMGSFARARVDLEPPPPERDAEFRRQVARARDLAEARLAKAPRDGQAQYDLGAALGLEASYMATVEGRMLAGFRAARRSFDLHERVLAQDPSRADAGLIVGMYRYIVSTLSLPMRALAYVVGFGGNRDEGIALLQRAASSGGEPGADALFALVLIYNREGRYDEALAALRKLRALYPRNRLVVLESGATALRAGHGRKALALLDEGMAMLADDHRPRVPGEAALWYLKRGGARALSGDRAGAEADLRRAVTGDAQPWVYGRARLALGQLALRRGDRAAARQQAEQAIASCQRGNDPECVNQARKLARSAHGR
jgi:tetratricopeptide (TPR) repeat protein